MMSLERKTKKVKLKRVRPLLGTYVGIEIEAAVTGQTLSKSFDAGFLSISCVDRQMSFYHYDSDLSRLNRADENRWVKGSSDFIKVLAFANELFYRSRGIFDIRCATPKRSSSSGDSFQDAAVEISGNRVRKTGPWTLDLGGIAKGYAVDMALRSIRKSLGQKISNIVVNAGGDMRVWGKENLTAIRIDTDGPNSMKTFKIKDTSIATSTTNPRSELLTSSYHLKMPEQLVCTVTRTATVFAEDCIVADALTKVVLLASPDIASACVRKYSAKAVIFDSTGCIRSILQ